MEQRKLTEEDLEKAEAYIPLARKYAIIQALAPGCIERTEGGFWRENIIGKKLVCLYILTGFYLHLIDTSGLDKEKPEFQFTLEDYDRLRGVWEPALEGSPEMAEDFRELNNMLIQEVREQLAEKNDLFNRFQEALRLGLTPETVQELQKAVEAAKDAGENPPPPAAALLPLRREAEGA